MVLELDLRSLRQCALPHRPPFLLAGVRLVGELAAEAQRAEALVGVVGALLGRPLAEGRSVEHVVDER